MSAEIPLPIEFLTTTRLGEKGQITVPKEYREALRLESGAPVAVLRLGTGLLFIPEQTRFRQLCERIANVFASHDVTEADLLAALPAARQRVFERHYGEVAEAIDFKEKKCSATSHGCVGGRKNLGGHQRA